VAQLRGSWEEEQQVACGGAGRGMPQGLHLPSTLSIVFSSVKHICGDFEQGIL
jgi:hypothetical protein